ncbi:MAG: PAS domain S-box protein [Methanoregula sp.]|jgi:PAS domain S-box-containing protein|uniref:PAS domain-containing protein n=1 Tax=Methanoregula sp. TaxID=2052170 RepID=UPI003D145633
MKAGPTPFDQKLFLVFIVTFASMTAFEFAGHSLSLFPPDLRSDLVLSLFVSGLAIIIAYFPLNSNYVKNVQLLSEMERRHSVEKELRESESRLGSIIRVAPVGIGVVSDRVIRTANDQLCHITGYPAEELTGRSVRFLYPAQEDYDFVGRESRAQIVHKGSGEVETRWQKKDGTIIDVLISSTPVDPSDLSFGVTFTALDITERKRAETVLRESESLYRTVFENTGTAMAILEEDTTISHANEEMEKILGYSREEVEGRVKWPNLVAEEDLKKMVEYHRLRRTDPGSAPKSYEFRFVHKNGEVRNAILSAAMIPGTGKSVISIRDITELKKTYQALEKSEGIFRQLEEELPDYVIIHEGETIVFVNAEGARLMGKSPGQIIGTSVLSYAAPEYHDLIRKNIGLRHTGAAVEPYDIEILAPSGERRWVVTRATPLRGREKPATLTVLTDITERKRAEEALRQANKNLNLLYGITRHDINNQLQALNGFVELLHVNVSDPAVKDYFSRITEASSQIAAMIRFTKDYEEIGVRAAVWQDLRALADSAGTGAALGQVALRNDLPAGAEVFADPLIVKVFFNLIDNALRHGGRITTIRFAFESRNGDRIIICEDDGDGVARGEKEKIFERGFGKNTGFGLAISREILDITGITIRETGEPGRGARFEILVPKGAYRIL